QTQLFASFPPVPPAIHEGSSEGEASGRPDLQSRERKRGREIQRDREGRCANDVRSCRIEIVNQEIADNAPQQSFKGGGAHPAQMSWKQGEQCGEENQHPGRAEKLRQRRGNLARAEPALAEHSEKERKQKGSDAERLQDQVGKQSSYNSHPIAGGA